MHVLRRYSTFRSATAFAILFLSSSACALGGPITYMVTVNTNAISGTSGFLDFSFAPGNDSQAALVNISAFSPVGSLIGGPQINGGVSGTLAGTLTLDNSTQFNDYFQAVNYGATLSFLLGFNGPALSLPNGTSTSGSTFGFGLFDNSGLNPLLTVDPSGNAFTVDVNLDGTTSVAVFPADPQSGLPAATVQATPEPSTFLMLLLPVLGLAVIRCGPLSRSRRGAEATTLRQHLLLRILPGVAMMRFLFLISILCLSSITLPGAMIYNNLGPGNTTGGSGYYTSNSTYLGASFVATGTGNLGTVLLYLSSQITPVTVDLYATSSGQPGALLESWNVSPPNWFGQLNDPPITSLASVQMPLLTSGSQYWVLASPAANHDVGWFISGQLNNGPWLGNSLNALAQNSGFTGTPTVQLNTDVSPSVPEPGTAALVVIGFALLVKAGMMTRH